jgi:hypothetical protein
MNRRPFISVAAFVSLLLPLIAIADRIFRLPVTGGLSSTIADCRFAWTRGSDFATRMVVVAGCMGCSFDRLGRTDSDDAFLGKVIIDVTSSLHSQHS